MKKLSNKEIVKILERAKTLYIHDFILTYKHGICHYIISAYCQLHGKHIIACQIPIIIPKFKFKFCKGNNSIYWWELDDTESRINAFNKLIEYYSCNNIIDKIEFYIKWYVKNYETNK